MVERICQVIIMTGFAASVACLIAGAAFWIAASRCLVREAKERFWYHPLNGPLTAKNLTPEGLRWRRLSLRFLMLWIAAGLVTVVGGGILLAVCGVDLEPRDTALDPDRGSGTGRIYLESHGDILRR